MMQLFVLGPAFGLPSIDAECIATIALMKLTLGSDYSQWTISACTTVSPGLPLLVDNDIRRSGFDSISRYLAKTKQPTRQPTATRHAHSIAIAALLQSRAPLLISAYIYVSSENYHGATRGAFSPILSPFTRLLLPPSLRSAAQDSTSHLGLSTSDIDSPHEDRRLDGVDSSFEAASRQRASLIIPSKNSVKDLLANKAKGSDTFRLHALADALFAPLQEMLAGNTWLDSETQPGSTDCLAYGFLSLMHQADMPNKWLQTLLNDRYPALAAYASRMKHYLEIETQLSDIQECGQQAVKGDKLVATGLPWKVSKSSSLVDSAWLQHLLGSTFPSFQSPAIVPQSTASGSPYSLGLLTAFGACAISAFCGGLVLLRQLYNTRHGEHVQIFGLQPSSNLDHLSQALAGLGGYQRSQGVDMLDISPSSVDHPLSEASIDI